MIAGVDLPLLRIAVGATKPPDLLCCVLSSIKSVEDHDGADAGDGAVAKLQLYVISYRSAARSREHQYA